MAQENRKTFWARGLAIPAEWISRNKIMKKKQDKGD